MKIRVKKITPLQAGKVMAVLYGLVSIVFVPFLLLGAVFDRNGGGIGLAILAVVLPVLYTLGGFVGGIVGSWVYNLVAGWVGGMELEFEAESTTPQ